MFKRLKIKQYKLLILSVYNWHRIIHNVIITIDFNLNLVIGTLMVFI
jgi:hypothetical protein